jgi:hypothetical protein
MSTSEFCKTFTLPAFSVKLSATTVPSVVRLFDSEHDVPDTQNIPS